MSRNVIEKKAGFFAFYWRDIPVKFSRNSNRPDVAQAAKDWEAGVSYEKIFPNTRRKGAGEKGEGVSLPCVGIVGCFKDKGKETFVVWCLYSGFRFFKGEFSTEEEAQTFAKEWLHVKNTEEFVKKYYYKLLVWDLTVEERYHEYEVEEDSFYYYGTAPKSLFEENLYYLVRKFKSNRAGKCSGLSLFLVPEQCRSIGSNPQYRIPGSTVTGRGTRGISLGGRGMTLKEKEAIKEKEAMKRDPKAIPFQGLNFMKWVDVNPYGPEPLHHGFVQCNRCGDYYRKGKKAGHPCDPKLRETGYLPVLSSAEALEKRKNEASKKIKKGLKEGIKRRVYKRRIKG